MAIDYATKVVRVNAIRERTVETASGGATIRHGSTATSGRCHEMAKRGEEDTSRQTVRGVAGALAGV